jgi:hypothetical protein
MDVMASLALYARGRSAWNEWAEEVIEWRKAIIAAGDWAWARDSRTDIYPTNKITGDWMQHSAAVFSYWGFDQADFRGFVFPGCAVFICTKFQGTALFRKARFRDGASFNRTCFGQDAAFEDVEFCSQGDFTRAEFRGVARFDRCRFVPAESEPSMGGLASFNNATFRGPASFADMHCDYGVHLTDTHFADTADFDGAVVSEMFFLSSTDFDGRASFRGARLPSEIGWSRASFASEPDHSVRPRPPR